MRVFVLALDALEYNLVKKWKLKNLMQKQYGYFKVRREYWANPSSEVCEPLTPIIWSSFITGRKPREHGIKSWWAYGRILERIRWLPLIRHVKGKRKILKYIGIKPHVVSHKDLKCNSTIFDVVKPSIPLFIPAYNEPEKIHEILTEVFERGGLKAYIRIIWKIHEWRKRALFSTLEGKRDWKLFMVWFDIADLIGHTCIKRNRAMLLKAYLDLNRMAGRLQKMVPNDTVFLIVSDHGMQAVPDDVAGRHTDHAFWSLNIETDWRPKDFTDFFPKIIEWVKE